MIPVLEVEHLHVAYGGIAALKGASLSVARGEIVAVIGANGAGKSTLLRTIVGLKEPTQGDVRLNGVSILGRSPEQIVANGICLVPEGRHVFTSLNVVENIMLGATTRKDGRDACQQDLEKLLGLFPILKKRFRQRAGQLSGGEQQMLAIARALMAAPTVLLLDEPSLGLAPLVIRAVYAAVEQLRRTGVSVLVVEQNIETALSAADRAYVLDTGTISASGKPEHLRGIPEIASAYFGGDA